MTDGKKEQDLNGGASPETKQWVAWREEVLRAAAEDHKLVVKERREKERQIEQEYHSPIAFYLGLLVLLGLLVAGWFIVDAMRCDPFYADGGLSRSRACQ